MKNNSPKPKFSINLYAYTTKYASSEKGENFTLMHGLASNIDKEPFECHIRAQCVWGGGNKEDEGWVVFIILCLSGMWGTMLKID